MEELVDHGYLGDVIAEYEMEDKGEFIVLRKSYDEDDFVKFDYDLGGELPSIEYESVVIISKETGFATHGEMNLTF